MRCIKTGAWVLFEDYGFTAPADLFTVGEDTIVVKFNGNVMQNCYYGESPRPITHKVQCLDDGYWRSDIGVLVVPQRNIQEV